jgi:hypothetical protein
MPRALEVVDEPETHEFDLCPKGGTPASHIVNRPGSLGDFGKGLIRGARIDATGWRNVQAMEQCGDITALPIESIPRECAKAAFRARVRIERLRVEQATLTAEQDTLRARLERDAARRLELEAAARELAQTQARISTDSIRERTVAVKLAEIAQSLAELGAK